MKQKYSLNITNPCRENWKEMSESDVGKFCNICVKDVIDLTNLSDNELIKIIENSNGKLCGRLYQNQLDRILIQTSPTKFSPKFHQIMTGLLLISSNNQSLANQNQDYFQNKYFEQPKNESKIIQKTIDPIDSVFHIISGIILLPDSTICTNSQLILQDTEIQTSISETGSFKLEIPEIYYNETMYFSIVTKSKVFNVTLTKNEIKKNTTILLKVKNENFTYIGDLSVIGGVCVTRDPLKPKNKKWKFWKKN
ncbi:MAG: hypothetical protein HYR91_00160 [Flavobacteriia bacterium]|nr:hypothetical protein [Flavobacteriia bacterium]